VNEFSEGLLTAPGPMNVTGFNFTVFISQSNFSECTASTISTSVRPGTANGGGGAVYASGGALSINVIESHFNNSSVHVASGATGVPSNSSGGALAVEVSQSIDSAVTISSCSFSNCLSRGADMINLAVRGGAVAVFGAAAVSVAKSAFHNCSIDNSGEFFLDKVGTVVVSGGAGLSVALARKAHVDACVFDASNGRDDSKTSSGLLVLSNRSSDIVQVSGTSFVSSVVALSVQCISSEGLQTVSGPCDGPVFNLLDSRLRSLAVVNQSTLMMLQSRVLFVRSRMVCASDFHVFRTLASDNSSRVTYNCSFCPTFFISASASDVMLDNVLNAPNVDRCVSSSNSSTSVSSCSFGVAECTTSVRVTRGFWTNFTDSGSLERARRCPRGYCGCVNANNIARTGTCQLTTMLSINRSQDPLCTGFRTGKLCGGCPPDFTQSMDGVNCIKNEDCKKDMWWVWTLSVFGFVGLSFLIIPRSERSSGALSCVLFYWQMAWFATSLDDSDRSEAQFFEIGLLRSLLAFYERACYAPDMSAYNATAARLIGSFFVLFFSLAWTCVLSALHPLLQLRNIDIQVSYSGTLVAVFLYVFSSVADVLFTLVECTSYDREAPGVVIIDGTVACLDTRWQIVLCMVVLMCLFPAIFAVLLFQEKLPASARAAVCRVYTDGQQYWAAVTLVFRLLISLFQFLRESYPNILAFMRCSLSMCMLALLINYRPYKNVNTFLVDIACYVGLIAQFGLQSISESRDFFGIAADAQKTFFQTLSSLSTGFRYAFSLTAPSYCSMCSRFGAFQICSRRYLCLGVAQHQHKLWIAADSPG
jgi:hypothetical protein